MMRIGWSSEKKKVGIGRLIDWLVGIPSLLEFRQKFRHCWNSVKNSVIAGIPSLRGFEEAEAISLKIPSKIIYCVISRLDRGMTVLGNSRIP